MGTSFDSYKFISGLIAFLVSLNSLKFNFLPPSSNCSDVLVVSNSCNQEVDMELFL